MQLSTCFSPVQTSTIKAGSTHQMDWGKHIKIYSSKFPSLKGVKTAIFSVVNNENEVSSARNIRKYLYGLRGKELASTVADLGEFIMSTKNRKSSWNKLAKIIASLHEKGIVPIVLSTEQTPTFAQYLSFSHLKKKGVLVNIDPTLDFDFRKFKSIRQDNYLYFILTHPSSNLLYYMGLGLQSYYNESTIINEFEKFFGDIVRLGELRNNLQEYEPSIRFANFASFDMASVRNSDAPNTTGSGPNGLHGEEFCQLMRFAGMNENMTSLGLYQWQQGGQNDLTAQLIAQGIWYFAEGVKNRTFEDPANQPDNFYQYIVSLSKTDFKLTFFKSRLTNRWWLEIPASAYTGTGDPILIPCSYNDYQLASQDEIPPRCWNIIQKIDYFLV